MGRGRSVLVDTARVGTGLAVVIAGIAAYVVATGPGRYVTYAGRSDAAATLMLATGTALVVAGLSTSWGRRAAGVGDLALLVGATWFASPLVGWSEGPPAVRAIALVVSVFTVPLLLHLVVAITPRPGRVVRSVVVTAYVGAVTVGVAVTMFRDPYFDTNCFANCSVNPFLVHHLSGLVHTVEVTWQWWLAGLGLALVGLGAARLGGQRGTRRRSLPIAVPAMLVGAVVVVRSLVGLGR
ncbi:MAG: hypothetical protein ABIO16_09330, partial [Nocardioides sp.]